MSAPTYEKKHPLEFAIFAFLVLTFLATAFAAWYTREQARIASDVEVKQLRAYVGPVDDFKLVSVLKENGALIYQFMLQWANYGETPAYGLVASTADPIFIPPGALSFQTAFVHPNRSVLMPKQQAYSKPIYIPAAKLGEGKVFFWSQIEYNDIFPRTERHITRICRQILGFSYKEGLPAIPENIALPPILGPCSPEADCADEQCRQAS